MTTEHLRASIARPRSAAGEIGVLLAGGSVLSRRAVRTVLSTDQRFGVLGEARTRTDLLTLAGKLRPAAVVLDPEIPQGALAALAELMATHPVPVVVYGDGELAQESVQAELRAAGAVDVVIRTGTTDAAGGADLRSCLLLASRIRVIRHPRGKLARVALPAAGTAAPLVVLGASTGGPTALGAVLAGLPAGLDAAVLVVQHMPAGFLSGLAGWLDGCCPLPVTLGRDGDVLRAGQVVVCPGGLDSLVEPAPSPGAARLRCVSPEPVAHHVPSVDRAFTSIAAVLGRRAIAVLLTGMGRDGAAGMLAMRAAGAATVAQDESTSTIYGMPQAAVAAGAAGRVLPLPEIADAIADFVVAARRERTAP